MGYSVDKRSHAGTTSARGCFPEASPATKRWKRISDQVSQCISLSHTWHTKMLKLHDVHITFSSFSFSPRSKFLFPKHTASTSYGLRGISNWVTAEWCNDASRKPVWVWSTYSPSDAKRILGRRRKGSSLQLLPPAQQGWELFLDTGQRWTGHWPQIITPMFFPAEDLARLFSIPCSSFLLLCILCYARCALFFIVGHPVVPPHLRQNHPQDLPPEPAPEARPTRGCWGWYGFWRPQIILNL